MLSWDDEVTSTPAPQPQFQPQPQLQPQLQSATASTQPQDVALNPSLVPPVDAAAVAERRVNAADKRIING